MPDSTDSVFTPRHRWRSLAGVLASIASALACLIVLFVVAFSAPSKNAAPRTHPPATGSLTGAPSTAPTTVQPSAANANNIGPVNLIQGTTLVNGVYLGYPNTTAGAVSGADQYVLQLLSTLDPDRAAAVASLIADPGYTTAGNDFGTSVQNTRQSLGLPLTGQVPPGYSESTVPVMYQLRGNTPTSVTVLFLAEMSVVTPSSGTKSDLAVLPIAMHWTGQDWRMLAPVDGDAYLSLSAQPNSPDAVSKGWAALITEGAS